MKYLSIIGWIGGAIFLAYSLIPRDYTPGVIRIACDDSRMGQVASHLSSLLSERGIVFTVVPRKEKAEVAVDFVRDLGSAQGGTAFGFIAIRNDTPMEALYLVTLHEILHDAGVSHEPEDVESIMHTHTKAFGQLKPNHIKALRNLPGITPMGYAINYIKARWF